MTAECPPRALGREAVRAGRCATTQTAPTLIASATVPGKRVRESCCAKSRTPIAVIPAHHCVVCPRIASGFERLAGGNENVLREFQELIVEEHPVVRQRYLARPGLRATPDQACRRHRVVQRAKRTVRLNVHRRPRAKRPPPQLLAGG